MDIVKPAKITLNPLVACAICASALIALTAVIYHLIPNGTDWDWLFFRNATWEWLDSGNPYRTDGFFNPPWLLAILFPISLLPEKLGVAANMVITLAVFAYAGYRMGAKPFALVALLLSAPMVFELMRVNVEWVAVAGLLMPPEIGLFFVLTKPQLGIGIALYWLITSWQRGKAREVLRVFTPVSAAFLLSLAIYGLYPLSSLQLWGPNYNRSLFPYSIPLGLALLYFAVRASNIRLTPAASLFLSPYVALYSYSLLFLSLVNHTRLVVAASILSWVVAILLRLYVPTISY